MTVSSSTRKAGPFNCNGVLTSFPFTFKCFSSADVRVVFTSTSAVETDLVLDTDYTISLNADQNASPGGTVETLTAYATGEKITVVSNVDFLQETDIQNQGGFYPEVIENALDKVTMQVQQVKEIADRAVTVPISSNVTPEGYLATVEAYKISAANSASSASASSALAVSSAINASASETNALNSANAASASEINASNSEISAGASATTATTQAGIATTQAGIATTQAGISTTQAGIATTKASEASLSASNALTSENNAAFSASSAAASYDAFDDRYLGAKSTSPTVDNDGNTLLTGALYFDITANSMKVWNGSAWLDAYASTGITDGDKGDIVVSSSGTVFTIDNDAVKEAKIATDAVTTTKVKNASITNSKLSLSANDSNIKTALNASGNPPIYACRAWVNFKGTGTVAIRASGNVSSITDNGTGDYTVNFTTDMPDANYAVSGACSTEAVRNPAALVSLTTSSVRYNTFTGASSTGNADVSTASITVFC